MNGKQLKNSILQWAIQGKLVPQDPNDEPASVLLERIRAEKKRLIKEGKIKKDKNESIIFRGEDNSYYEKFDNGDVRCIDDEIPFDLPIGWAWCRISNLFLHSSGKQQSSNNSHKGTLQKYITTSNLYWGHFVLDKVKEMYFSDEELVTCSATKGDLLVCEGGAGYGRSAIWENDYDICLQNHIHRLRPIIDGICEYVMYYLYFLKETNQLASVGTAMPGLSANRLKGLTIPLPPLQEQQRIIQRVRSVMPVVDKYGHSQASLDALNDDIKEKLKKSILQEAIQGRLVSQDSNEEPASMLLNRIAIEKQKLLKEGKLKKKDVIESVIFKGDDNKYYENVNGKVLDISEEIPFDLPGSWQWSRFASIVNYRIGKTPARGETVFWEAGTYPWVSISDMKEYGTIRHTKENITERAAHLLGRVSPQGTLLMSFKLTVGRTSILDIDAYHNEAIISIWPFLCAGESTPYLFFTLPLLANLGNSKDAIKGRTLNRNSINNLLIPIPPINEQKRIVERIKVLYQKL